MLHLKQWHYSLHRDFQNCNSTRRSPTGFFSSNSTRVPIQPPYTHTIHPENSPSRIQFYMQKTKSSSSTTTTYRGQRDLHSRKEILHIEGKGIFKKFIHVSYKTSKDIPDIPDIPVFPMFPDLPVVPDIPVIHDIPASPGNSTSSSTSRVSTPLQHSPIRMHILHILHFNWFPQETPLSTS